MKLCVDCKHYVALERVTPGGGMLVENQTPADQCMHPDRVFVDCVRGGIRGAPCRAERHGAEFPDLLAIQDGLVQINPIARCGVDGRYWEPKA